MAYSACIGPYSGPGCEQERGGGLDVFSGAEVCVELGEFYYPTQNLKYFTFRARNLSPFSWLLHLSLHRS